jgi:hypothetical protein
VRLLTVSGKVVRPVVGRRANAVTAEIRRGRSVA